MNITELQNRITELEKENEYLKALLDNDVLDPYNV